MTADDYLAQLRALLPPGPAWSGEMGAEVDQVLQCLAPEFARVDARGDALLAEMDPRTVRELLPDWERVMGLPDTCLGPSQSFDDRRAAVFRRMFEVGDARMAYYVQIAVSFGYTNAQGVEYRAPRFGRARFGQSRFGTWAQQFFWGLRLGGALAGGRRFGATVWGERFGGNPNEGVECVVRREAHAHTVVMFDYEQ